MLRPSDKEIKEKGLREQLNLQTGELVWYPTQQEALKYFKEDTPGITSKDVIEYKLWRRLHKRSI